MANTEYDVIPMLHGDGVRIANALEQMVSMKNRGYILYGFHLNNNESDPSEKITYLEDAVGAVPAYMDYINGVFNYGSWKNAFFMPRPCMVKSNGIVDYYLNPDNLELKEDGTASDIANVNYDGNAMMEWGQNGKKIWMKIVPDSTGAYVYISDTQIDSLFHDYAFVNKNNVHMDHFYTPIFNGSKDTNGKMRSLSGQAISFNLSGSAEVSACTANGDGWYIENITDRMLINMLLILMGKSTHTQKVFGEGMTGGGESAMKAYVTGSLNNKGLFYGYNNTNNAVKVFGMENYWGCQWRRTAGLIQKGGKAYYKLTRGTADGTTATDYNSDGTGYIEHAGALDSAGGGSYISTVAFDSNVMIPSAVGASANTHMCDAYWVNTGATTYALYGGASGHGSHCGAFCVNLDNDFGVAYWDIGCAPSYKPLA